MSDEVNNESHTIRFMSNETLTTILSCNDGPNKSDKFTEALIDNSERSLKYNV